MKKNSVLKFLLIIALTCIMLVCLCSCQSLAEVKYYSEKGNYIEVTGTVSHINYNEDSTVLYIDFSELSLVLDDTCFKIVGDNLKIVQNNKIDDKLKIGEQISFITAPKYFGDGYVMPIVEISIRGENLLEFEEGYTNLLNWLSE